MCGRTACTLVPDVNRACTYKEPDGDVNDGGKYKKPRWREHPPSKENGPGAYAYYPSTNLAPTRFTPVMIIKKEQGEIEEEKLNIKKEEDDQEVDRVIMPMTFGLIPFWHKGPAKSHGLSTNNCRLEGVLESKLYKRCWQQRKFCVVLCQGFYEWKTTGVGEAKGVKRQPYLIYQPQKNSNGTPPSSFVVDKIHWENAEWSETDGWNGPEMLKMAGLYDVWKCPSTGDEVYSYTIITFESNETLSWLHHRMPAILDTDEKVEKWLGACKNPKMKDSEIMELLQPVKCLQWHKVHGKVGNSRCHDDDCMKEVTEEETKPKNTFMDKWLLKKTPAVKVKREQEEDDDDDDAATKDSVNSVVKRVKKE